MGEKMWIFFFFLKNGIFFMGGCFFYFLLDLFDLYLFNICILKRVWDIRLIVLVVSFNCDFVWELFYFVYSCWYFCWYDKFG